MHSKDLRILLEKALGFPVWNDLWDYLDELGFVKEVLDEAADINYLTDRANKVLSVSGSGSRREAPRMLSRRKGISTSDTSSDSESLRTRAVSILLAQEAAEEMQVQSFRREILEEKLLVLEEVSEWMKTQAKADGPETKWLYVQVDYNDDESIRIKPLSGRELFMLPPPGSDGVVVGEGTSNEMDIRVLTINYLEYSVPGIPWPQLQPIALGGVLYRLWLLVANLSARYSWTGAQATMFILTGLYPEVRGIRILEVIRRQRDARITLMIDLRVPPREVADEYQRLRREMVSGRRRSLSDKHLRLAAFVAECPQSDSWEEKMRGWNETYAESKFDGYRYTHRSNFIRDALKAQQHLLQPEYDFHKRREEGLIETDRVKMGDDPEFANPTS